MMKTVQVEILETQDLEAIIKIAVANALSQVSVPKIVDNITLLTRTQTAKLLNITLPTVDAWTKQGVIIAYRMGGRVFFKQNEILESLNPIEPLKYGIVA